MSVEACLEIIRDRGGDAGVKVVCILGSGLGHLANTVDGVAIDYADLPGFPVTGVSGHNPKLVIGNLEGVPVAILGGRAHFYEHGRADEMRTALSVMAALGAEQLFATNAAGSMREDLPPGDLMLIEDHINFSGRSPLIGEPTDKRFVNLTDAYDAQIRSRLQKLAANSGQNLLEGVYAWYSGPNFETPAEIRALRTLGADAVGMSTVPEVILGRFLGLRCAAVSVMTNMAAGLGNEDISHDHTKQMAPIGAAKLAKLLHTYLRALAMDELQMELCTP